MGLVLSFLLFSVSLAALLGSAHYFLRSARHLGVALGFSPFIVGFFILALGTSFPEAVISVFSSARGSVSIPVAQVVGSNIANILFVLGLVVLFVRQIPISRGSIVTGLPILAVTTLLFVLIVSDGVAHLYEGLILLAGFAWYVAHIFYSQRNQTYPLSPGEQVRTISSVPGNIALFFLTSAGIALASYYVVFSAQSLSSLLSVSEEVIAFIVLALGTSLPEAVVSVQAALRREIDFAVGNIIGSNIFNILFVTGVSALVAPLSVDTMTLSIGVPALVGVTALLIVSALLRRIRVWDGVFYLLLYALLVGMMAGIL